MGAANRRRFAWFVLLLFLAPAIALQGATLSQTDESASSPAPTNSRYRTHREIPPLPARARPATELKVPEGDFSNAPSRDDPEEYSLALGAAEDPDSETSAVGGSTGSGTILAMVDFAAEDAPTQHLAQPNTPPPAPQLVSPADDAIVRTRTPTLQISSPPQDADGQTLTFRYFIQTSPDADAPGQLLDSGWISSQTWSDFAYALEDGTTYHWTVWSFDGLQSTPASGYRSFSVDLGFGDGSGIDSLGPVAVDLGTGNASVSVSSRSYATAAGGIGLSYTYNSMDAETHGLRAQYFDDIDTDQTIDANELRLERVDSHVSFEWGTDSPYTSVPADHFMVRWTGTIAVPSTGSWEISASADNGEANDGARIWVGQTPTLVYSNYLQPVQKSPVQLTGGSGVPITIEYYEGVGAASIKLVAKPVSAPGAPAPVPGVVAPPGPR